MFSFVKEIVFIDMGVVEMEVYIRNLEIEDCVRSE